jgi:glycosyltransferase involved in cell wall biosynthesis
MKKVLIISYYFPPSGFVGGERVYSWYYYLLQNGYYPIIITRNWDVNQKDETKSATLNNLSIEKTDKGEIHRLPYNQNLRDKLVSKMSFFSYFIRKFLTFSELITIKFSMAQCPYKNIYVYSEEFLTKHPDCEIVIISGKPFNSFRFGYLLKKKFKYVNWIADYRDEWTTMSNDYGKFSLNKLIWKIDSIYEKKWIKTASFFTTTSENIIQRISELTSKKGFLVLNGFNKIESLNPSNIVNNTLNFLYSGTLYNYQRIELFIELVKKMNKSNLGIEINLYLIGVDVIAKEKERVMKLVQGDSSFIILERMTKSELLKYYEKIDCFYLTSYEQHIGWLPVKIFDYVAYQKNILLYPSDNDVMEKFIKDTQSGFSTTEADYCEHIVLDMIQQKLANGFVATNHNIYEIEKYSRKNQTKVLSKAFDTI